MTHVIIGLGSNLGNREHYLSQAISKLGVSLQNVKTSALYESPAMLPENAPASWNTAFLNMVISGDTTLDVYSLLKTVKSIEQQLGRGQTERWGPREIDIDILMYGNEVIDDEHIHIPHQGILERAFVIQPICNIEPQILYPRPGIFYHKTMQEIMAMIHSDESNACTRYTPKSTN